MKKLYLIDGSGFIFRAYHALPPLNNPQGEPVGAVYGFCNMLIKVLQERQSDHMAVIFDAGRKTFRQDIYPEYKAHRPPAPDDLVPQFQPIRDACIAFGIPHIESDGFEADDLIATYAQQAIAQDTEVVIISSDKDLMQLINSHITLFDPMKNKIIAEEGVFEKFGVTPDKVIDIQALAGDSSDNVPGVPGIGPKIAAELINRFGSLENLYKNVDSITQIKRRESLINNQDLAFISKKLVTLRTDASCELLLNDMIVDETNLEKRDAFLNKHGFYKILKRLDGKIEEQKPVIKEQGTKPLSTVNFKISPVEIITTEDQLKAYIDGVYEKGHVAVDTETTSLDTYTAKLVGISLCVEDKVVYIPLKHIFGVQMKTEVAIAFLKPMLADEGILKIGHNLKYDRAIFLNHGADIRAYDDTLLLSYVLNGTKHLNNLDTLSQLYLNHETIKFSDICGTGKNKKTMAEVDIKEAAAYAGEDAETTYHLWKLFKAQLTQGRQHVLYERVERPMMIVTSTMEHHGIYVDPKVLDTLGDDFLKRMAVLESEIHEKSGETFNLASPKQLGEVLFDKLKLPGGTKTKTGNYVTDADALEKLSNQGFEVPTLIHQWRSLAKLQSTYVEGLKSSINSKTGRVHTSYSLTATNTGRFASTNPNLQNIPVRTEEGRKIRSAFLAAPSYKLLSLDYSQIELRLLAHMANVEPLIKAFNSGEDIHKLTASQVFHIPLENVTSDDRRKAKAVNFGIIYGISAYGLAEQIGVSNTEAKEIIQAYMAQYPGIQAFMEEQKEFARAHDYVETILGRKCYTLGINDKNGARRQFAERQAINAPLQGSNADIIKMAMYEIHNLIIEKNMKSRMLLTVHDELVFEIHDSEAATVPEQFKNIMEKIIHLSVPLKVDMSLSERYEK
ncbi:MAG TPA: DNA polymerase I [Holosporales bacterium]|nr:DNA polymerase I [Holosporales bacterium]